MFSLKGRATPHRRILAEAGDSIERFFASGVTELKTKLGPILWQFHPGKKFRPDDFAAFLALLPRQLEGKALRHVVEVRRELRRAGVHRAAARILGRGRARRSAKHPLIADLTSDSVYARLQGTSEKETTGYPPRALDLWARRARTWSAGGSPDDLATIAGPPPRTAARDVFVYMISGARCALRQRRWR